MGEPKLIVLLYSQYSEECGRFIETAKNYNIDYITPVCIDNSKVRQVVRKSIKFVPTLLFIYDDGMVDTYQGEKAMLWLDSIIRPIKEKLEREERERIYQQEMMRRGEMEREVERVPRKKKKIIVEEEEEPEPEEEKPEEKPKRKLRKQSGITMIDDDEENKPKKSKKKGGEEVEQKKSEKDKKREELTQKAAEMAKSREIVDQKLFPKKHRA